MNILLYFTIIFLVIIFIYFLYKNENFNENFININKIILLQLKSNIILEEIKTEQLQKIKKKITDYLEKYELSIKDYYIYSKNPYIINIRLILEDSISNEKIKHILEKMENKDSNMIFNIDTINLEITNINYDFYYHNNQYLTYIPYNQNYNFYKDIKFIPFDNITSDLQYKKFYNLKSMKNNDKYINSLNFLDSTQQTLKPYKSNTYSEDNEVTLNQLNQSFKNLLEKYNIEKLENLTDTHKFVVKKNYNKNIFINIQKWLVENISKELKIDILFSIKSSYVIEYSSHNKFHNFELIMKIFREGKITHYNIYCKIIVDIANNNYFIEKLIIVGEDINENLLFGKYKQNLLNNNVNCIHSSFNNTQIIDKNSATQKDFIKKYENKQNDIFYNQNPFYCFYKNADNEKDCKNDSTDDGTGLYDSPCVKNEDCDFYKSNKNYENSFGKCNNGYCEMPLNLNLYGYKKYNNEEKKNILCHNCKKDERCIGLNCHMCCEEQKDKTKYPNLEGPDYAFENDLYIRLNQNEKFKKKNLSPFSLHNL